MMGENRRTSGVSMRQEEANVVHEPLGAPTILAGPSRGGRDELRRSALQGAAERDLRETTMMMGVEREVGLRSDVVLERIWVWKPPA
jgi:hypothetical protein